MALFEIAEDQLAPVEVRDCDDGRTVVRFRSGAKVDEIVGELNDLFDDGQDAAATAADDAGRPPIVVVVVR